MNRQQSYANGYKNQLNNLFDVLQAPWKSDRIADFIALCYINYFCFLRCVWTFSLDLYQREWTVFT